MILNIHLQETWIVITCTTTKFLVKNRRLFTWITAKGNFICFCFLSENTLYGETFYFCFMQWTTNCCLHENTIYYIDGHKQNVLPLHNLGLS